MIFHSFTSQEERKAFGGSAFLELQYCKLETAKLAKILSLRALPYWQNDGLYIHLDDMQTFFSNYAGIFGDAVLSKRTTGCMDLHGINYYPPAQLKDCISKIEAQKPLDYEPVLEWLKIGERFNGFYLLGI